MHKLSPAVLALLRLVLLNHQHVTSQATLRLYMTILSGSHTLLRF